MHLSPFAQRSLKLATPDSLNLRENIQALLFKPMEPTCLLRPTFPGRSAAASAGLGRCEVLEDQGPPQEGLDERRQLISIAVLKLIITIRVTASSFRLPSTGAFFSVS